ncbi:hypothetical protein AGMMS4952_18190 [Spirochaetia bacterium]|nr:hypothetical protein AGMMS4952_18190 [Spirochaetia bacterium]
MPEKKLGKRFVKQLFTVLLILFKVEKQNIIEGLDVSRFSIKKFNELIGSGNIEEIFKDNVYRQKSELDDYKVETRTEKRFDQIDTRFNKLEEEVRWPRRIA